MEYLQLEHASVQWRLYADASKVSLKAMLMDSGSKFISLPLTDSVHVEGTCENFQLCLCTVHFAESLNRHTN